MYNKIVAYLTSELLQETLWLNLEAKFLFPEGLETKSLMVMKIKCYYCIEFKDASICDPENVF